ncbi:DPP IV N-terminal domain-containing protein [Pseudoalteromonas sp. R86517]|uniref:S9 family peptidase n=1 Tax=Pseudoalteromonas sp. R86517 TaxID=3093857 RepID=UPI00366F6111
MKKLLLVLSTLLLISCQNTPSFSKKSNTHIAQARQYSAESLRKKVHNLQLTPNWLQDNDKHFWFERYSLAHGQEFVLVSTTNFQKKALFNKAKLEQALDTAEAVIWHDSPMERVSLSNGKLKFDFKGEEFLCDITIAEYACELNKLKTSSQKVHIDYLSPDEQYYAKVENYNLFLCETLTHFCKQLTTDGSEATPYAVANPYPEEKLSNEAFDEQKRLGIYWSKDSKYFISYKLFRQGVNQLTLTDSVADKDFNVNAVRYYYPQAGDVKLPMGQLVLVDVARHKASLMTAPKIMQTYYGTAVWGQWHHGDFYYQDRRRGNQELYLRKVVAKENKVVSVIKEIDEEFIDPWVQTAYYLDNSERVIWSSQRTGYQHLYLYDLATGKLINPITKGDFTVRAIRAVDEENGVLYFEASGRESNRDPYLRHLYRVNLDGSNLKLLTPEPFEHDTRLSPDLNYIIDNYSDAKTPTQSWLRDANTGEKLVKLDEAQVSELFQIGWQPPEPFKVIAEDGVTPLYGLMYKPSDFDENQKYPIIDDTYTGPHNFFTPKSFATFMNLRPALAELGAIVIKMDGRGTSKRGRAFHRFSYKNLAGGTDDHVWAIKQLAKRHRFIDIDRVGIFGFSAGGYDTVQAMLRHDGFFKAGVSASGNHDFRVDKAGWNELWMGWPMTEHWEQQSNYTNVERLKGKLLLAHGELDSNVHPSATLRLVDKLIKAKKDFDLLIIPKMGHVLDANPYFVEKRWQFFIEHLQLQ